ncbi:hypothetical protein BS47DRAFT_1359219 [Hydnum rufescens UP504]|uniref:Uncharacterized protein n=1 Tax=Hydnum rufescens UP504 TaxID=1448309 RepID=A0A9P6B5M9_9AGAM|nr:hypothetical protein BS47DRAFT_1359219 [Hydnum rufescens UP504]
MTSDHSTTTKTCGSTWKYDTSGFEESPEMLRDRPDRPPMLIGPTNYATKEDDSKGRSMEDFTGVTDDTVKRTRTGARDGGAIDKGEDKLDITHGRETLQTEEGLMLWKRKRGN